MSNQSAIELGQHITALLTHGKRTTTYKFALSMALMDYSIEHLPNDPKAPLKVSIRKLADYAIGYYWNQVEMYDADVQHLFHGTGSNAAIPSDIRDFKSKHPKFKDASVAREKSSAYPALATKVARALAKYPVTHLQTPLKDGRSSSALLYKLPWPAEEFSLQALKACNWEITLLPGVAWGFAHLSQLLRPFIELQWQNDIVRFNSTHLKTDRLSEFLWGASRLNVGVLASDLTDLQDGRCFYCSTKLNAAKTHVDHVLPWSRFFLDGISNLVAADEKCNLNKSDSLPIQEHVKDALSRNLADLTAIATTRNFAVMLESTTSVATNIYKITPAGTPLWRAFKDDFDSHMTT
jgi:hypothetical protein